VPSVSIPIKSPEEIFKDVLERSFSDRGIAFSRLENFKKLTGGASHDTWAFDLISDKSNGSDRPLVFRRTYGDAVLGMPLEEEFFLMKRLYEQGYPVPYQLFIERDRGGAEFGSFSVCERVSGTDLRKALSSGSYNVTRKKIGERLVSLLAELHKLDSRFLSVDNESFSRLSVIDNEVKRWTVNAFDPVGLENYPVISAASDWLNNNIPDVPELTIVHGDFKANNILYSNSGEVFVLDWELAHIGDPLEDLAWSMLWNSDDDLVGGIYTPQDLVAEYERRSGAGIDRRRLFYWQLYSLVKLSVILLTGSGTLTSSVKPSVTHTLLARAVPSIERSIVSFMMRTLDC